MKILISGASGMVGSHVLKFLLETTDYNFVAVCGWQHKGEPSKVSWAMKGHESRVKILTHDLSKPFTQGIKKEIGNVDIILNIASDSHVDRSIESPVDFVQNNVNLSLTMLEYAREVKPKLFLQFSTDEVYGVANDGINHAEWSPIIPSNPYSASKACQEAIAISYWRTYGVPVVITNTMNVFSENQDWEKFIPLCVKKIMSGEELTIHAYPGGTRAGSRFYIHANSVAEAVKFIMGKEVGLYPNVDKPDRYNIVGDVEIDNLTLAQTIANILGKELKYSLVDFHSSRPGHDTRYALDGTKLAEAGWTPTMLFKDKIQETILKLKDKFAQDKQ
jgi:dTDP-glucose 4,6-dehydratase